MNQKIIEIVETAAKAEDKNAAISEALSTIRKSHKLDLWETVELKNTIDFIYLVEGLKIPMYITATATRTPREWIDIEYF